MSEFCENTLKIMATDTSAGGWTNGTVQALAEYALSLRTQVAELEAQLDAARRLLVPRYLTPILGELERAIRKFPTWPTDPIHASKILDEEAGELSKAVLQATYEPHKSGPEDVKSEAIQAAAMAIRFIASLDEYQYVPSIQHEQTMLSNKEQK